MWTRWKTRQRQSETNEERWYTKSFAEQMATIECEISRVLRTKGILEKIRNDLNYIGEPQTIQHTFEIIKKDPKNVDRLGEIERAEKETFAFLSGEDNAPTAEEMKLYWDQYIQAYMDELQNKK